MPEINEQDKNTFTLTTKPEFSFSNMENETEKKKRSFSGVAYSGEKITGHWYWGDLVFDLSTMSVPNKLPALLDHLSSQRCGFVENYSINDNEGFTVKGTLLSNKHGREISDDSDEGFPWQMSVRINPGSVEEVASNTSVSVNGRMFQGPITVFRNSNISEVSFTALGWDSNTSAVALSKQSTLQSKEHNMAMTEQEQNDFNKLQQDVERLTAENAALVAQFSKAREDKRLDEIKSFCKDTNQEFVADSEETKAFSAMSDDVFLSSTNMLKAQFSKINNSNKNSLLFSHQANEGEVQGGTTTSQESPLVKNAKERSK